MHSDSTRRIAVIGSGISGMAAAYYLSRRHEVTLFEKEDRLGGHTHTVEIAGADGVLAVDTGFIVHNDRTYPNLVRLLAELGVATAPSDMSFAVYCPDTGFEYSSRGLRGFFARRTSLFRPEQYQLLREIMRFNRQARALLLSGAAGGLTLGAWLDQARFSPLFAARYLFPMASAVWSMPALAVRDCPALTLLRFFDNHGMLGIHTHPQWKVIRGGSSTYIAPLTAPYHRRIVTGARIRAVSRSESAVTLHLDDSPPRSFDDVVFACHGDQVLPLLSAPSDAERSILGAFETSRNEVCLHTDSTLLPRRPAARASWNYRLSPGGPATVTYHMNRLQSLQTSTDYCVTLNGGPAIDPNKVLRRMTYRHPLFTLKATSAQARWAEISGLLRTHFCGAYWFHGFHEDGLNSALRVARALGVEC